MKEAIKKWAKDGIILIPIVGHWVFSLLTRIIPASNIVVEGLSKLSFKLTTNEYRYQEFLAFWNKRP